MGTSVGAAIDYLVAGLKPVLTAVESTVQVVDGMPETMSETMVFIGRTGAADGTAADNSIDYAFLGATRIEEQYTIPGYIDVYRPGPVQKPARDAALSLFDPLLAFIHSDPTFGGILRDGRIGRLTRASLRQTEDDEDTAGGGYMRAVVSFDITVHNAYIP